MNNIHATNIIQILSLLLFSGSAWAAPNQKPDQTPTPEIQTSRNFRKDQTLQLSGKYSYIDFIIPSKKGAGLGWIVSDNSILELEYLSGSLSVPFFISELGEMKDTRASLLYRNFLGTNTFNLFYGISYFDFTINLGSAYLNRLDSRVPSVDVLSLQSIGPSIGIGNQWIFWKHLLLGLDWVAWNQPLISLKRKSTFLDYVKDPSDRDKVSYAMRVIQYFPRFSILKLNLGFTF